MSNEDTAVIHQVFGPPGTGKTRFLTQQVRNVVRQRGPDSIAVTSFTVTGANEIASRGLGIPPRAVGTLHSFAFRAIGHDSAVALDPDVLADWNRRVSSDWSITPDSRRAQPHAATEGGGSGELGAQHNGDDLIAALDRARAVFTTPEDYPPTLAAFAAEWEKWKSDAGAVDYTDMIEQALTQARDGEAAPGNPQVFVVDEGQDMTPLEVELALAWGSKAASLVVALDDDQAIMEWRGGSPRKMLTLHESGLYTVDRHVLGKSFRIPRAVHAVAERWVRRLSLRQEKEYRPRTRHEPVTDAQGAPVMDEEGYPVERDTGEIVEGAAYCVPEALNDPVLIGKIEKEVERGRSVMVIASCAYMLEPLIKGLRSIGLPYFNPFRPAESRWNPFGASRGMSTAERVFRYLVSHEDMGEDGRLWTGDDLRAWIPLIDARRAGLAHGAKKSVEDLPRGEVDWEYVAALFADEGNLERAVTPELEWLAEMVMGSKQRATSYPLQVARKRGPRSLAEDPQVVIGTIHSVKGAAADVVYVAPDMSTAAIAQLDSRNGRDQTVRLFYVAMTRAREELRLLAPVSVRNSMKRRDLIPSDLEVPA